MTDPPRRPDSIGGTGDNTDIEPGVGPGRGPTTSAPRWVKVSGVIALAVVLLFVILLLAGGHGPGRHVPSQGAGGQESTSWVTARGEQQP